MSIRKKIERASVFDPKEISEIKRKEKTKEKKKRTGMVTETFGLWKKSCGKLAMVMGYFMGIKRPVNALPNLA